MTYDPTVPTTGAKINAQYLQLQQNFSQANTIFGYDHYEFNNATTASRGLHKTATLVAQTATPAQIGSAGKIFAKVNPATAPTVTRTDPYYVFDSGSLGTGLTAPLLPIKAFGSFWIGNRTGSGTLATSDVYQAYNVASVTYALAFTTNYIYTINFQNKLSDDVAGTDFPDGYIVMTSLNYEARSSGLTLGNWPIIPMYFKNSYFQIILPNPLMLRLAFTLVSK